MRQRWEILGDELGGYGCGFWFLQFADDKTTALGPIAAGDISNNQKLR